MSRRDFVTHQPEFGEVIGPRARLRRLAVVDAHEGPVFIAGEDALYFTSVPARGDDGHPIVAIRRLSLSGAPTVTTLVADANAANGMTLDAQGRLVVCEQGSWATPARISRCDPVTGTREEVTSGWDGGRLESPNDIVVAGDGAIWFTDPAYGHLQGFRPRPQAGDRVFRHDVETGVTAPVAGGFDKPNGIALGPGGRTLYVTDSGADHGPGTFDPTRPHHIVAFDVGRDGALGGRRIFAEISPGVPDGLKVDLAGRVYVSSASGVQVLSAAGIVLGEIRIPGAVNFCFGGRDRRQLFITDDASVWVADLAARG